MFTITGFEYLYVRGEGPYVQFWRLICSVPNTVMFGHFCSNP